MDVLRTPESRFAAVPRFDYEPHYCAPLAGAPDLRMHFLDEGPHDAADSFLCLHGQPTWSYLYRHMIPVLLGVVGLAWLLAPPLMMPMPRSKPSRST